MNTKLKLSLPFLKLLLLPQLVSAAESNYRVQLKPYSKSLTILEEDNLLIKIGNNIYGLCKLIGKLDYSLSSINSWILSIIQDNSTKIIEEENCELSLQVNLEYVRKIKDLLAEITIDHFDSIKNALKVQIIGGYNYDITGYNDTYYMTNSGCNLDLSLLKDTEVCESFTLGNKTDSSLFTILYNLLTQGTKAIIDQELMNEDSNNSGSEYLSTIMVCLGLMLSIGIVVIPSYLKKSSNEPFADDRIQDDSMKCLGIDIEEEA